ncbi:hypothetical protein CLV31_10940 [Algoriphagus aquaeductus]|uniref:Uncharacterized protein n=1 Tax=Algoriphagus aquaeductus TaxID=475299 RepID=A0A326RZA1_9BACT|nr:hypothetical protein [Algoriphagus aquaeductus]PZV82179.1 hypothetical protein CLV31_10940 [Algoriphagus aquaeductus]
MNAFLKFQTLEKLGLMGFFYFFNFYAQAFHKKYLGMGSLFMNNFKRKPDPTFNLWQETLLYNHLIPLNHEFVKHPQDWTWSSGQED